jgi:hypothetical protein
MSWETTCGRLSTLLLEARQSIAPMYEAVRTTMMKKGRPPRRRLADRVSDSGSGTKIGDIDTASAGAWGPLRSAWRGCLITYRGPREIGG